MIMLNTIFAKSNSMSVLRFICCIAAYQILGSSRWADEIVIKIKPDVR